MKGKMGYGGGKMGGKTESAGGGNRKSTINAVPGHDTKTHGYGGGKEADFPSYTRYMHKGGRKTY